MEDFLWNVCSHLCHQSTDSSFVVDGMQIPLCYRCFAWCVGVFIAVLCVGTFLLAKKKWYYFGKGGTTFVAALLALMPIDGYTQALGLRTSNMALRLGTGAAFGIASVMLITSVYGYHKLNAVKLRCWLAPAIALVVLALAVVFTGLTLTLWPLPFIRLVVTIILLGSIGLWLALGILGFVTLMFKKIERDL